MSLTTYYVITLIMLMIALLIFVYQLSSLEGSMTDLKPISFKPPITGLERMSKETLTLDPLLLGPRLNRIEDGLELFRENKTIFIIETDESVTHFKFTLLCAVESALRSNPHFNVAIITASEKSIENAPLFLSWCDNVTIHVMNISSFMKSSQVSNWFSEQQLWSNNAQDLSFQIDRLLKFVLLYNYGGIYMGVNTIAISSFSNSPSDFVVPYDFTRISSSFMRISKFHPLMKQTLHLAMDPINVNCSSFQLITMATIDHCDRENTSLPFLNRKCSGGDLQILPIKTAFPLRPSASCQLYLPNGYYNFLHLADHKYALVLHHFASNCKFWLNREEISDQINVDRPILKLMEEYCPFCKNNVLEKAIGSSWHNVL